MRLVSISILILGGLLVSQSNAAPSFYTIDTSSSPAQLIRFDTDAGNTSMQVINELSGILSSPAAVLDYAAGGRLFIGPTDTTNTIHAVDPSTGELLGSVYVGGGSGHHINGIAASDTGLVYVSQELSSPFGWRLWEVDFDAQSATSLCTVSFDIDDIDFDNDGNLIGNDINETGRVYRIPLDGSTPELLATLPVSDTPYMTFSAADSAFYFKDTYVVNSGRGLHRLSWNSGRPTGQLEYVKSIGVGTYVGIAAVPEPSTMLLLGLAGLFAIRRRRDN